MLDGATGLIYVGNGQYYDPVLGRFVQPDIIVAVSTQGKQAISAVIVADRVLTACWIYTK